MSEWDYEEDDADNRPQQQRQESKGGGMRAQLEAALRENKELKQKLTTVEADLRREAVARVISAKGLKPKVAKLIPADVDPTDDAIGKWLEEWGDVFGVDNLKVEVEPESKPPVENSGEDDMTNQQYAERLAAMGRATSAGGPPMKDEDVLKKLQDPSLDRKSLMEMINAAGGGYGTG
jgi:hypothetical protein